MTEHLALPVGNLIVADDLSVDECAMVEFLAIGALAVRRGFVTSADRALIIGAGPIGLGAGLFAKLAGADITVMDRDGERLTAATELFETCHTVLADDDAPAKLLQFTDGDGTTRCSTPPPISGRSRPDLRTRRMAGDMWLAW